MIIECTILVSAFPGTGKSLYSRTAAAVNVLDSDSSKFDKKKFPQNYINHIKKNIGKVNVIFISSHKEVREALVENGLWFILAYPHKSLKKEYMQRFKNRGDKKNFIKLISDNWDEWLDQLWDQENCGHIVMDNGEYIADIMHKTGLYS